MASSVVWGLTGLYCAGKNRAGSLLEDAGCHVIDVDKLGHLALDAELVKVLAHFGDDILDGEGKLDRRALGRKVFGHPEELKALELIVHPWAIAESERIIAAHPDQPVVINAALLFPSGMYRLCSKVIWIKAPLFTRITRARRRDGLSFGEIIKRFWSQRKLSPQHWRKDVDIESMGNPNVSDALETQIRNFFKREL